MILCSVPQLGRVWCLLDQVTAALWWNAAAGKRPSLRLSGPACLLSGCSLSPWGQCRLRGLPKALRTSCSSRMSWAAPSLRWRVLSARVVGFSGGVFLVLRLLVPCPRWRVLPPAGVSSLPLVCLLAHSCLCGHWALLLCSHGCCVGPRTACAVLWARCLPSTPSPLLQTALPQPVPSAQPGSPPCPRRLKRRDEIWAPGVPADLGAFLVVKHCFPRRLGWALLCLVSTGSVTHRSFWVPSVQGTFWS